MGAKESHENHADRPQKNSHDLPGIGGLFEQANGADVDEDARAVEDGNSAGGGGVFQGQHVHVERDELEEGEENPILDELRESQAILRK